MACSNEAFSVLSDSFNVFSNEEISFLLTYLYRKISVEKDILKCVRKYRENGGLEFFLNLLNRSNNNDKSNNNESEWIGTAVKILHLCSEDESNCTSITNEKTISSLIAILKSSNDDKLLENICQLFLRLPYFQIYSTCGETLTQVLMHIIVSKNHSNCGKLATILLSDLLEEYDLRKDVIKHLLRQYNHNDTDISLKVLFTLAKINIDVWSDLLVYEVETVINIWNLFVYAENGNDKLKKASLKIMGSIAYVNCDILDDLVATGIIAIYIKQINEFVDVGCDDEYQILNDLETYCENEVSRKLISDNGLETLISLMNRWDNHYIIDRVFETICFLIDYESSREKMLSLGLVSILITKLSECLKGKLHQPTEIADELITDWKIDAILEILLQFSEFEIRDNLILTFLNSSVLKLMLEAVESGLSDNLTLKVMKIISNLKKNYLKRLITLQFADKVLSILGNNAHSVDECVICNNSEFYKRKILDEFKQVLESCHGIEIVDKLLTEGSQREKEIAAMLLPYILSPKTRRCPQFLNVYNQSLNLILQILTDSNNNNFSTCFECLMQIFTWHLQSTSNSQLKKHEIDSCAFNSEIDKDVCFVLDDGQRVFANRQKVSESSDMFDAMLNGGFIEAKQSEISFGYASRDEFELTMHLLHGCDTCSCPELRKADEQLLFDTASMADRMVLIEEKDIVLKAIVKKSTSHTIVPLCEYAFGNNFANFLSFVIDYVIGSSCKQVNKFVFLYLILNSELRNKLLQEIKKKIATLFNNLL